MAESNDRINGWEVRRDERGYCVYDRHGMVSGPHLSKTDALRAALQLPVPLPKVFQKPDGPRPAQERPVEAGED